MKRSAPAPISPLGPGMRARRLRIASHELVRLGALLSGYDHLASIHDHTDGSVLVITTVDREDELDAILHSLQNTVNFQFQSLE
jgi:hypothetical protein